MPPTLPPLSPEFQAAVEKARREIPFDGEPGRSNSPPPPSSPELDPTARRRVKRILEVAREMLRANGWIQGDSAGRPSDRPAAWMDYYKPDVHYADRDDTERAIRAVAEVVYGDEIPRGIAPIIILSNWNEEPGRTVEDVLDAYTTALERLAA